MSLILLGVLNSQAAGAGGATSFDLLETQVLTSSAASVTFTGLDSYSDYKHLQMRMLTRNDYAGGGIGPSWVRFNNVSTNTYSRHILGGNGSSVYSFDYTSQNQIYIYSNPYGTQGTTNMFGAAIIDILDFSSTSKNTTIRSLHGGHFDTQRRIEFQSGLFVSTNAVTRIDIISDTATDFIAGSRFSLYGVK